MPEKQSEIERFHLLDNKSGGQSSFYLLQFGDLSFLTRAYLHPVGQWNSKHIISWKAAVKFGKKHLLFGGKKKIILACSEVLQTAARWDNSPDWSALQFCFGYPAFLNNFNCLT